MNIRYLVTGIVLIAVLVGGIFWLKQRGAVNPQRATIAGIQNTKTKGPQNASIRIVEYSDFQCPACQKSQQTLQQIMERFPGKMSLTFKHFPLAAHQGSPLVHQAAECAHEQKNFWPYHDRLFAQQNQWAFAPNLSEILLIYAKDLGLDLDAFANCLADPKIRNRVLAEKTQGEALQIKSTPTFFINDERAVGLIELQRKMGEITGEPFSQVQPSETVAPASGHAVQK